MKKKKITENYNQYILSTYTRTPAVFVKGKGMDLIDIDGKKYLDFFPGWGVNNVGHCHVKVMAGVRDQVSKLIHIPNNFYHPPQVKLAKEIIRNSFPGKVFFCNSGAEACEAAIKFAKAYGKEERTEIITMNKSFHGRTIGALTATGQEQYKKGFQPLLSDFHHVPFNSIEAVEKTINNKTIGIIIELVQGEGGINIADKKFIQNLRKLCNDKDILLIFDEVQTGMGRTGEIFAFKHYGVEPDLMILAKALGGGLPIGALVASNKVADTFQPGMHASTFGGSPLVCRAALGAFSAIHKDKMLQNTKKMGQYLKSKLQAMKKQFSFIKDVRGLGLMLGIELSIEGQEIYDECFKHGLIINCTQKNVLRLMPALNVTKKQADKALSILEQSFKAVKIK